MSIFCKPFHLGICLAILLFLHKMGIPLVHKYFVWCCRLFQVDKLIIILKSILKFHWIEEKIVNKFEDIRDIYFFCSMNGKEVIGKHRQHIFQTIGKCWYEYIPRKRSYRFDYVCCKWSNYFVILCTKQLIHFFWKQTVIPILFRVSYPPMEISQDWDPGQSRSFL